MKNTFAVVQCNCSTGWEGDYCELDMDGCQDNPCTGGTNCTDLTPEEQVVSGVSFNCSECPTGTEDDDGICLPINECDPTKSRHNCEQVCVDLPDGYKCMCNDGYRLDNTTHCKDINECDEGTSDCEHECRNTEGSYRCSCVRGYTLNVDNATCNMNVDECAVNNAGCESICTNFDGGFNCSCKDGFQLMNDKKVCQTCPSGTWGKDCLRDCNCRDSDTKCNETTGCAECPDGFKGPDCQDDIDECLNSTCDNQATCSNSIGTFKCVCDSGFTQYNATSCQDLDECDSAPCENGGECEKRNFNECESTPCQHDGVCQDLTNKYRCACVRGFTGKDCETEIDICESNPCKYGANCTQSVGKYTCSCTAGYTGLNCATDIDDCAATPCMNGGVCVDQTDRFVCNCALGYTGTTCETGPLCKASPCRNGGSCVETNNTRTCHCVTGYTGTNCQTGNLCETTSCQNGGLCSESGGIRSCKCVGDFTGDNCQHNLISTLSPSKIARLAVSLRLVDISFTPVLKDKSSDQYKTLNTTMVKALKHILDEKLGPGKYEIADVTFSSGSLIVTYDLNIPKDDLVGMQSNVVQAIKEYKGKIAGSSIEPSSVKAPERQTVGYYGQFRIPTLKYLASYNNNVSAEYEELATDVKETVEGIYRESDRVGSKLIGVTIIKFTNGSVVVDFSLWLDASLQDIHMLKEIFTNQKSLVIAGHAVEMTSFRLSGLPWLGVILGTAVGLVLLILVVILVVYTVRKCRSHRNIESSEPDDASTIYSSPFQARPRFWQERTPSMSVSPATTQPEQYNRMRMNIISNAVKRAANIDWSMMQNFARRNVGQKDDLLRSDHQRGRRPRL
ncbi:hypothetical protein LSAT2_006799 [Lamellibrachia satsuma]|nr:hypothetical protein LSAT2_006799 [Lamellibrachia satsuma]